MVLQPEQTRGNFGQVFDLRRSVSLGIHSGKRQDSLLAKVERFVQLLAIDQGVREPPGTAIADFTLHKQVEVEVKACRNRVRCRVIYIIRRKPVREVKHTL